MRGLFAAACAVALLISPIAYGEDLTPEAINAAQWSAHKATHKLSAVVLKAQVLLDRAGFSPGVIDGHGGDNFTKALAAFQARHDIQATGKLDEATWSALNETSSEPAVVAYTIDAADVEGPFVKKIPHDYEKMAELDYLGYRGPREALAEKFHMDEDLLGALNKGAKFEQGEKITVTDVRRQTANAKAARVKVNKSERSVTVFDADGALLAFYPASIGSEEKPAPSGAFKVRAVARNPTYRYNPNYGFKGQKAQEPVKIAPGPNGPVGLVWIDLTAKSYGIHGTSEPAKVSKSFSHGCIRLTNWDALALAKMVKKGTPVEFVE